jgi:hypothetical protein
MTPEPCSSFSTLLSCSTYFAGATKKTPYVSFGTMTSKSKQKLDALLVCPGDAYMLFEKSSVHCPKCKTTYLYLHLAAETE